MSLLSKRSTLLPALFQMQVIPEKKVRRQVYYIWQSLFMRFGLKDHLGAYNKRHHYKLRPGSDSPDLAMQYTGHHGCDLVVTNAKHDQPSAFSRISAYVRRTTDTSVSYGSVYLDSTPLSFSSDS